jgi:ribosomal protein S18 acetylase RimI-like enzyme
MVSRRQQNRGGCGGLATQTESERSPKSLAAIDFSASRPDSVAPLSHRAMDFGNAIRCEMSHIQVRPAGPADEKIVVEFNCRLAAETEAKQLHRPTVELGVRAILSNPQHGRYFLATIDGRVVGQMMHTWEWSDWRNGEIWWLQSVYVHPDFRRQGVFRALIRHLQAEAAASPNVVGLRLYVEEHNTDALATYERLGLKRAGYVVLESLKTNI